MHDRLELAGWQVEIADAQKVKGLAPLACKTDRIDARGAGRASYLRYRVDNPTLRELLQPFDHVVLPRLIAPG